MDSLQQLWPLVRPHRRALAAAIFSAVLAAGLWAVALLLAFPITKVLLEQRSLQEYVATELADVRSTQLNEIARITLIRQQLNSTSQTLDEASILSYQRSLRQSDREISRAAQREWRLRMIQAWLMPLLPEDRFDLLTLLLITLLVVTALHGGAVFLQEVWVGRVVQLSMRSLRVRLFRQTLTLDPLTVMAEGTPSLMSRFTNDLTLVSQGLTLLGGKIVLEPLKAASCIASAFFLNWRLTLLSLLCAPLGAFLFQRFGKKLKKASRRQMETVARIYAVLQESLSGFRVVTAFGQQRHHRLQLYRENRAYYRRTMSILKLDALANPTVELLAVCGACLAILPGAYLLIRQKTGIWGVQLTATEMDLASLALLYSLLIGVLDPARKLSSAFSKLKKSVAACERVTLWMDRHGRSSHSSGTKQLTGPIETLEFRDVSFSYPADEESRVTSALSHIDVRIQRGDVIAIVGGNGSGKSTLAGLIPRFYDATQGQVLVNAIDVRDVFPRSLRAELGWVPQEPMLFDRTIAENIADGKPGASGPEIQAAANLAHVTDFAGSWDEGLNTLIGTSGSRLSGGQRQRIALARALIRQPQILILDEATSAIDAQSESLIYDALRHGQAERITLVITHTLTAALLAQVTRVMFLDQGALLAIGPHEQLLRTCPPYAELFAAQSQRRAA